MLRGFHEGDFWDSEMRDERFQGASYNDPSVYLDAHIMATPTIADLSGNGARKLVVPVTYFFDEDKYSQPEYKDLLDHDLDITKYLASE